MWRAADARARQLTFAGDGQTPAPIGRVARTWPIHSPTRGHGTVVLTELAR